MLARILKRPRPDTLLALSLCLVLSLSGAGRALAVDDEPLFDIDGRTYTVHELPQRLRDRLYQLEKRQFEERLALLDSMLFELHVRAEAERTGEAAASIAERLLHLEDPTEADIQAYYEEHAQSIGRPLQEAREQIGLQLRSQALLQRRQKLLADIKAEREFKLHQTPPAPAPVDIDVSEYARRGPADAPITVVEFGDYQCPRCRDAGSIISRLMEKYPGELQWYYLDFPVNRSGISTIVAYGGICAHRQDHFWSYHDLAFDEQARLDNESALELARALDLDLDAFKACLGSAQTIRAVAASRQVGKSLGVSLTPGIFVNGRPFMTDALWDHLETLIQIKKQQRESRAALRKRLEAVEANRQSNNQ